METALNASASERQRCSMRPRSGKKLQREAARPQSFLVAIPCVAMMVAVVAVMVAARVVVVAVAMRCVAVTGVHRLLGRCGTR
jgi:predicted lysophospholipase L1 biosynthesis ABC-type transport system permease subunit